MAVTLSVINVAADWFVQQQNTLWWQLFYTWISVIWSVMCTKFITYCVQFEFCMCANFCPVDQLITEYTISVPLTKRAVLCYKMLSYSPLTSLVWYVRHQNLWMHPIRWENYLMEQWFSMQNLLQLFDFSADSELKASVKTVQSWINVIFRFFRWFHNAHPQTWQN